MRQGSLFDIPPREGGASAGLAGLMPAIRAVMHRVAGEYEPGRKELVDRINAVAAHEAVALTKGGGKTISKEQLDKWLQPSDREHAPEVNAIVCFCLATGDASPIQPILKALGLTAVPESDLDFINTGKACIRLKQAKAEMKKWETKLL